MLNSDQAREHGLGCARAILITAPIVIAFWILVYLITR